MAEDEDVEVVVLGTHAFLASLALPGLVDDAHADVLHLDARNLGQAFAQLAVIVVAPARDESARPRLQLVEEAYVDPVAGVDHDIGGLDCSPDLRR